MLRLPQISVIVPVYNTESYLHQCIDSILNQSFKDFELLLIDDGSKDGSGKICDVYAEKDSRIRVWHQENQGVSVARNVGLENAQGEWIYFPDSDDIVVENAFEIMMKMITENIDYVIGGYEIYDEEGNSTYAISERKQHVITRDEALMEMFAPTDYRYQGYLWNKLFKAAIIRDNNLRFVKGIKFNEDRLYNVEYLCCIKGNVAYTTVPVYHYVERSPSAMASLNQRFNPAFITDLEAFVKMRDVLRTSKLNETLREAHMQSMLCSVGRMYSICRQFGQLNMKWRYDIESRFYKGVGFRLYMKRWIDKLVRKINRLRQNS